MLKTLPWPARWSKSMRSIATFHSKLRFDCKLHRFLDWRKTGICVWPNQPTARKPTNCQRPTMTWGDSFGMKVQMDLRILVSWNEDSVFWSEESAPQMVSMESDQRLHGRFQRNKRITLPPSPHQSRSWTPHGLIWSYHLLPVPYPYPKFKGQKQQMHLGFKVFRYLHSITSCPTAKSNSPSPLANLRHLSTWSGKFGIHNCQCQTETSTLRSSKC